MQSKSGPAHELDSLAPWGQRSFMCTDNSLWKKSCKKHSGNKASQFFYMLVLALFVNLASQTQPMLARIAFSIKVLCQGLACKTTLFVCSCKLFGQLSCCLGHRLFVQAAFQPSGRLYSFHAVQALCKPFRQLSSHLAWFLNGTTSLRIIESGPTSLKAG